jgi:hypothetical protein
MCCQSTGFEQAHDGVNTFTCAICRDPPQQAGKPVQAKFPAGHLSLGNPVSGKTHEGGTQIMPCRLDNQIIQRRYSKRRDLCVELADLDNNSVAGPPVEYEAPFRLEINEVDINRLNNTVKLDVILTDTRFSDTLSKVNELSDRTSDIIDTTFWAAPGDVVVLAGVTRNEEATTTSGLPGMTGTLAPVSLLLGGSDAFSTNLSETLIFMAPTVINPSADNQPHSAFRNKPKRSIVN